MIFTLTFHGIGDPQRELDVAERDFWISESLFHRVVDFAVANRSRRSIQLSFDDGNVSDFTIGLERLIRERICGSFFVLAAKLGTLGYLSASQLKTISASGMSVGLHGMDHVDWTRQDDVALRHEIIDARNTIESIIGERVTKAAVPFGRYNRRVLRLLRQQGFERVYTSDRGIRFVDRFVAPRQSVRCDTDLSKLADDMDRAFSVFARCKVEAKVLIKSSW